MQRTDTRTLMRALSHCILTAARPHRRSDKGTIVLMIGMGTSFLILILMCAFEGNWWPMMMFAPLALYPIPIMFTDLYEREMKAGDMKNMTWWLWGQCMNGALAVSFVGCPLMLLHLDAVRAHAMALWCMCMARPWHARDTCALCIHS